MLFYLLAKISCLRGAGRRGRRPLQGCAKLSQKLFKKLSGYTLNSKNIFLKVLLVLFFQEKDGKFSPSLLQKAGRFSVRYSRNFSPLLSRRAEIFENYSSTAAYIILLNMKNQAKGDIIYANAIRTHVSEKFFNIKNIEKIKKRPSLCK